VRSIEIADFLWDPDLKNLEVIAAEIGNHVAGLIGNHNVQDDKLTLYLQRGRWYILRGH
jgi:hypothetical protein